MNLEFIKHIREIKDIKPDTICQISLQYGAFNEDCGDLELPPVTIIDDHTLHGRWEDIMNFLRLFKEEDQITDEQVIGGYGQCILLTEVTE